LIETASWKTEIFYQERAGEIAEMCGFYGRKTKALNRQALSIMNMKRE